jgi:hypothetical protein
MTTNDNGSPLQIEKREAIAQVAIVTKKKFGWLRVDHISLLVTILATGWGIGEKISNYEDAQTNIAIERAKHDLSVDNTLKEHGDKLQDVSKQVEGIYNNVRELDHKVDMLSGRFDMNRGPTSMGGQPFRDVR